MGADFDLEAMDPVDDQLEPDPVAVTGMPDCGRVRNGWPAVIDLARASLLRLPAALPRLRTDPPERSAAAGMRLTVAYGTAGLAVDVPDDAVVVEPREPPALADEAGAVRHSPANPISGTDARRSGRSGGHGGGGLPRPHPPHAQHHGAAPAAGRAGAAGAGPDRVELLCATGTHRQATPAEMEELVGADIAGRYRIHDHVSGDGGHVRVGEVEGTPVLLDRHYVEAAVRIVTGFVEPHFFAGWSGGPKGVCPGLADTATILEAHSPARLADARSTWMRHGGKSRPRVRHRRHRAVPAGPLGGRHHRRPAPADRGVRRRPARTATGPPAPSPPTPSPSRWTGASTWC